MLYMPGASPATLNVNVLLPTTPACNTCATKLFCILYTNAFIGCACVNGTFTLTVVCAGFGYDVMFGTIWILRQIYFIIIYLEQKKNRL